ncbi:MAG: LysR family transcriptional regulator [Mycobacterium sp.]
MDLTVRKLRYFAVVAQERHITHAAARLFVAQQCHARFASARKRSAPCSSIARPGPSS